MAELHDRRPKLPAGYMWLMLSPSLCIAAMMVVPLIFQDEVRAKIVAYPVFWLGKVLALLSLTVGAMVMLDKHSFGAARYLVLVMALLNACYLIGMFLGRIDVFGIRY